MEELRKPFQGVTNIVGFNWHFYLLSTVFVCGLLILNNFFYTHFLIPVIIVLVLLTTIISLLVSYYVYDWSDLYKFSWLPESDEKINIVNISAGFDESSMLLKSRFKNADLKILDFYNQEKHTEISIKRARNAYPVSSETISVTTSDLTLKDNSADKIFVTLSAHEIRNDEERVIFFKELHRVLKQEGQLYITEHLRDTANFLAYNIGFFHFLSRKSWLKTFEKSNFNVVGNQKITPFITIFTLQKNGFTA